MEREIREWEVGVKTDVYVKEEIKEDWLVTDRREADATHSWFRIKRANSGSGLSSSFAFPRRRRRIARYSPRSNSPRHDWKEILGHESRTRLNELR